MEFTQTSPDHVGSTSYITDASGEVYQHLEYFPFGETFVEEHSNTNRTPYLFNGKELDEETGLYYYGARYYDPVTSVWQSVDPLGDMYPSMSPYAFSGNNPINYIDPDGKRIIGINKGSAKTVKKQIRKDFSKGKLRKFRKLVKVGSDGLTFRSISQEDFDNATQNFSADEKALAKGYFMAINSEVNHYVGVTTREEPILSPNEAMIWQSRHPHVDIEDVDLLNRPGYLLDKYTGGGSNNPKADSRKNVNYTVTTLVSNSNSSDSFGERLAHELVGHGVGKQEGVWGDDNHRASLQVSNLYRRFKGQTAVFRFGQNHRGPTLNTQEAQSLPRYLE